MGNDIASYRKSMLLVAFIAVPICFFCTILLIDLFAMYGYNAWSIALILMIPTSIISLLTTLISNYLLLPQILRQYEMGTESFRVALLGATFVIDLIFTFAAWYVFLVFFSSAEAQEPLLRLLWATVLAVYGSIVMSFIRTIVYALMFKTKRKPK